MADFSLFTLEWLKNILHKIYIFHTVNSKTRNKESKINKVYLISAFCVVLSSLLAEVPSHSEQEEWENRAHRERPLLARNRLLCSVKLRVAFFYVSTFVFWLDCEQSLSVPQNPVQSRKHKTWAAKWRASRRETARLISEEQQETARSQCSNVPACLQSHL